MNAQCQKQGPGSAEGDQVESRAVEHSWKHEIDGDRKDGATSSTQYESKQLKTQPLAENQPSQHGQRLKRTMHLSHPIVTCDTPVECLHPTRMATRCAIGPTRMRYN